MGAAAVAAVAIGVTCRARCCWSSSRALPVRARPVSSTSACRESPPVSTPRVRRRPRSSWRCGFSTKASSRSVIEATSSPPSRQAGASLATGSCGPSGFAKTSSFTTAPRLDPTRFSRRSVNASSPTSPPEGAPGWLRPFRGAGRIVREVRRGDGASIQVVLGQPYAPVLALLAHPALAVAIPRADGHRVGSGPYRAVELAPDRLVLEAAPSWRGEPPQSARLTLHAILDDAAALAGLGPGGSLHAALVQGSPGMGRARPAGGVRPDLAARADRASDRSRTHQPQDGRGRRWRSR